MDRDIDPGCASGPVRWANADWLARLWGTGQARSEAIAQLHELLLRAARHRVGHMPQADDLGAARREEIGQSAADEAVVSVLSRLSDFEGRSRFTTWAYKFGILHAGLAVRRAAWRHREVHLHELPEPGTTAALSPEADAEGSELARAVSYAVYHVLTPHQHQVAAALLIDEIPIDVLAERLASNRNALYKTLHEARKRLRAYLTDEGYLPVDPVHSGDPA